MKEPNKIETYTFYSPIGQEGSWGYRQIAKRAKNVMDFYLDTDNTGYIEWEIPHFGLHENIGLTFEIDPAGKRTLVDYDGVMTLPDQAMDLMEKHGIDCSEMRD